MAMLYNFHGEYVRLRNSSTDAVIDKACVFIDESGGRMNSVEFVYMDGHNIKIETYNPGEVFIDSVVNKEVTVFSDSKPMTFIPGTSNFKFYEDLYNSADRNLK